MKMRDMELPDGGVIEMPDSDNGTIRRRDIHGNVEEIRCIEDNDWQEWGSLFHVTRKNYS